MKLDDLPLDIEQHVEIMASPDKVFATMLQGLGKGSTKPDGEPMPMVLEVKPGGRWYRDRGNGIRHL
jgi:hypothetical protein